MLVLVVKCCKLVSHSLFSLPSNRSSNRIYPHKNVESQLQWKWVKSHEPELFVDFQVAERFASGQNNGEENSVAHAEPVIWARYAFPQRLSTGDMIPGDDDLGKGFFTDLMRHLSINHKTDNNKDEPFVTGRDLFNVSAVGSSSGVLFSHVGLAGCCFACVVLIRTIQWTQSSLALRRGWQIG